MSPSIITIERLNQQILESPLAVVAGGVFQRRPEGNWTTRGRRKQPWTNYTFHLLYLDYCTFNGLDVVIRKFNLLNCVGMKMIKNGIIQKFSGVIIGCVQLGESLRCSNCLQLLFFFN
jgi:hypothetical protein